jgi:hypothetical protein
MNQTRLFVGTLAILLMSLVGCEQPTLVRGEPGFRIVSGAGQADTIDAKLVTPLIIEYFDEGGGAVRGATVEFHARATDGPLVYTRPDGQATRGTVTQAETDGHGRVHVAIEFGAVAGRGVVDITVAGTDVIDSAVFEVLPGAATSIEAYPGDSALLVGGSYQLRYSSYDRRLNPRPDVVTFSDVSGPVTTTATGLVTASAVGRGRVLAQFGALKDTALISVVPNATFAAHYLAETISGKTGGFAIFRSDGAQFRIIDQQGATAPGATPFGDWPTWNPAGTGLLYVRRAQLQFVDTLGNIQRVPSTLGEHDDAHIDGATAPLYSANGAYIYFVYRPPISDWKVVFRSNADGTGMMRVSEQDNFGVETWPSPSPTGDHVVYASNVFPYGIRLRSMAESRADVLPVNGLSPRWSPDGTRIAYLTPALQLRVMNTDGTGDREIGASAREGFVWSPDNQWLLGIGITNELQLVNVESGLTLPLVFRGLDGQLIRQPTWKP